MSDSSDSDHKKKKKGFFSRLKGSDSDSSSSSSDEEKKKEKRKVKRKASSSSNEEKKRKSSKGSKSSSDEESKKRRGSKGSKKSSDEEKEVVKAEPKSEVVITETPGVEVTREVKVKTLDNGVEQTTTEVRTVTTSEHEVIRQERKIMVQEYEVVTRDGFGSDMPGFDLSDPKTQVSKTIITQGTPGFDSSDPNSQVSETIITQGTPGFDLSDPNTQVSETKTIITRSTPEFNISDPNTQFSQTKKVITTTRTHYTEVKDGGSDVQNVATAPVIQESTYVIVQKSDTDDVDKEKGRSRSGSESSKSSKSSDDDDDKKKKSSKSSSDNEKDKSDNEKDKSDDEKDKSDDEKAGSDNEKKEEEVKAQEKEPETVAESKEEEIADIEGENKTSDADDVKITWILQAGSNEVKSSGSDDEKKKKSGSDSSSSSDSEDEGKKKEEKKDKEDDKKSDEEKEKKKSDSESSESEDESKKEEKTKKEEKDDKSSSDEDEKKKEKDKKGSSSDEDEKKKIKDETGSLPDKEEKKKLVDVCNDDKQKKEDEIITIADDLKDNADIVIIDDKPEVAIVEQPIQAEKKKDEDVLDKNVFPKKPEKSPEKNKKSFKMPELPKIISSKKPAAKPAEVKKEENIEPEVKEETVKAELRKSTDNLDMFANKDKPKTDESKSDEKTNTPKTTENKDSEVKVVTDVKVTYVPSPDAKKDESGPSAEESGDVTPKDTTSPPETSNGDAAQVRSPAWDTLVPATTYWSTRRDGSVLLRSTETGPLSLPPITIPAMVQQTVDKAPDRVAFNIKKDGAWVKTTYKQYLDDIKKAAKGFIKLGLEPYHTVGILGENSPEWAISNIAAIFAGGLATGIFTHCTAESCETALSESDANIAVVENDTQLKKVLQAWPALQNLKAIVQITGDHSDQRDNVYTWAELMNLSEEVADDTLQIRLDSQAPNKACQIIYTSGTSGDPKPVLLSHDNLVWMADRIASVQFKSDFAKDVVVSFNNFTHITGLILEIILPLSNAVTVYYAQPDALNGSLVDTMKEVKPTMFFASPRDWEMIMEKMKEKLQEKGGLKRKIHNKAQKIGQQGTPAILKRLKTPFGFGIANTFIYKSMKKEIGLERCRIQCTGANTLEKSVFDFFCGYNIPIFLTYGTSEITGPQTANNPEKPNLSSVGSDIDGCTTKIVKDAAKNDEICVWGRHVMMGYLNKEQMTTDVSTEDNWLRTGDIGQVDEKGFLTFIDRISDCVVLESGEVVTPSPIEKNVIAELPIISRCVVVGDKRKFVSMLINLKVVRENGVATDKLSKECLDWCKAVGSESTTVSQILESKDENVHKAIQEGINRANIRAVSHTCQVKKWCILPNDLSSNADLFTPVKKLMRPAVNSEFCEVINQLYNESET